MSNSNLEKAKVGKLPSISSAKSGPAIREKIEDAKMKALGAEAARRARKQIRGK